METGEFYCIELNNYKAKIFGVFEKEGTDWILLKRLFSDFMLDGRSLISKKHLNKNYRGEKEIFKEKVLKASKKCASYNEVNISLNTISLFDWLYKEQKVFQISLSDSSICYIGKIDHFSESRQTLYLKTLGTRGRWDEETMIFRISAIRIIEIDTDYIDSLLAFNKTLR